MSNQAMKAAHADVLGHEVQRPRRRRHGQSKRDISGQRAMFTQRHTYRTNYRGATRHCDTKAMPGHPLAGLWRSYGGMSRSCRPEARRQANTWGKHAFGGGVAWVDEMVGVEL